MPILRDYQLWSQIAIKRGTAKLSCFFFNYLFILCMFGLDFCVRLKMSLIMNHPCASLPLYRRIDQETSLFELGLMGEESKEKRKVFRGVGCYHKFF